VVAEWLLAVAGWLLVVAGWLLVVAGWLLEVAGCWSRGAKKNTQISKDSTHFTFGCLPL
jgi:hypothetical protein